MFKSKLLDLAGISHSFYGKDSSLIPSDVPLYRPKQVHGTAVIQVSKKDDAKQILAREGDAIWTTDPLIQIAIQTADCAPILLSSLDGKIVGAIHAGWRGAVAGVIQETILDIQKKQGVLAGEMIAAIGPCIDVDSFEVGSEVVDAVPLKFRNHCVREFKKNAKAHLDLEKLCESLLREAGVRQVDRLGISTFQNSKNLYSHRRDGHAGRQLSVIRCV